MSFMLLMMVFQTLYVLVDLYWVGRPDDHTTR
jgi:Na+-driven multidrug efflux pump